MKAHEMADKNDRNEFPIPAILFAAAIIAAGAIITSFVLSGCSNPADGGVEGGVFGPGEIVIGAGGQQSRTAIPTETELAGITFSVILTGPGETIERTFGPEGGTLKLDSGAWRIQVTARNRDNRLRGLADEALSITTGSKHIVNLKSVIGIKTGADFYGVLDPASGSPLRSLVDGDTLMILEDDIDLPSSFTSRSTTGKFTLIAEEGTTRTVRAKGFYLGIAGFTLELGKSGETGNLVIDGEDIDYAGQDGFIAIGNGGGTLSSGMLGINGNTKITRCKWSTNRGGAIVVSSGGRLEMRGGSITNCTADYGGAVAVEGGVFEMSGGELRGNTATNSTSHGGGAVYVTGAGVSSDGVFTMTDGTISGNSSAFAGGAVYVEILPANPDTAFIHTGGTISGNTAASINTPPTGFNDVYPYWPDSWNALSNAAGVGSSMPSGSVLTLTLKNGGDWNAIAPAIMPAGNLTLVSDLNVTILRDSSFTGGPLFTVSSPGISLVLGKTGMTGTITLDGNHASPGNVDATAPLLDISGGRLEMYDGVTLQNNGGPGSSSPGGVNVTAAGTFEMHGGEISDNEGETGGVALSGGSTFIMDGNARIENNQTHGSGSGGGGVTLDGGSSGTMEGNAIIAGNSAFRGGGIQIQEGNFIIRGNSIIRNNNATSTLVVDGGGGVYISGTASLPENTVTMSGGTITGNDAVSNGGGVYIEKITSSIGGRFNLNPPVGSGAIGGNTAPVGKEVYADPGSTYTINGTSASGGPNYELPQP